MWYKSTTQPLWKLTHPYAQNIQENKKADKLLSTLYETHGIFDYDKQQYLKIFKSIVLSTMSHDKKFSFWKFEKIKLFKNEPEFFKYVLTNLDTTKLPEYSKSNYNFLSHIEALQIFISYNCSSEICVSISDELYPNEVEMFDISALPLYSKDSVGNVTVSIIVALTNAMSYTPDEIADIIFHEFMHILKGTQNKKINNNTSAANIIAADIMLDGTGEDRLPNVSDILEIYNEISINNKIVTKHSLYKFLATCVYYLDDGERSAYLNNFRSSCKNVLNTYDFNDDSIFIAYELNDLKNSDISAYYTIYKHLYNILDTDIQLPQSDNVIDYFFQNYNANNISTKYSVKTFQKDNITSYINIWKLACKNWLSKAQAIMNSYKKIHNEKHTDF